MRDWARKYGLLGSEGADPHTGRPEFSLGHPPVASGRTARGEGRYESLSHFTRAVLEAARTLKLYEALKAPGGPDTEILGGMYEGIPNSELEEEAWSEVLRRVHSNLETETYLLPYYREDGTSAHGPGIKSLLGALWIEMQWLLESGDDLSHCYNSECDRIVDFEQPPDATFSGRTLEHKPRKRGPYKNRKDKYFCRKSCYQLWRYHEKKAGRTGRFSDVLADTKAGRS